MLCQQTLMICSYQEVMHKEYGHSAFFGIYIRVPYNGKDYIIPGSLLVSLEYFLDKKPLLMLVKNNENLQKLNHSVVGEDGMVSTDKFKKWIPGSSFEVAVRDLVDKLQGDPYMYQTEDQAPEPDAAEVVPEPLEMSKKFNPDLKWVDIHLTNTMLGQGSYAVVYKGIYKNEEVAVKVWRQPLSQSDKVYFDREVEVQKRLDHPNCLKLYGVTEDPKGYPVLVTELADCSLTKLVTQRSPQKPRLSAREKYSFILEIAQGIAYIHSCGYVHRDIKLDNILVKNGHAKIADFGLARSLQASLTVTFAGSPMFMAPELIMGQKVTQTIDVYSLGCVIDEIMTEKTCYWDYCMKGITQEKFFRDIRRGLKPSIDRSLPKEVRYLIADCFKDKRYRPNAETICHWIENWDCTKWESKEKEVA